MAITAWARVALDRDVEEGKPVSVEVAGESVMVVRLRGRLHALASTCPHYGGPLHEGLVSDNEVVCPWHSARFDVATGDLVAAPSLDDVSLYEVKAENGEVLVRGPAPSPKPPPRITESRTFLVVGAGAAGNACAEGLRREGFAGRVLMVTPELSLPYDRPSLSKGFLAGATEIDAMALRPAGFYAEQMIDVITGHRVASIDPARRSARLDDGSEIPFAKALLATGAAPRRPDIPGADLDGVMTLRSITDALAIDQAASSARTVVVIGASFIGMEVAASLRTRGLEVHVVEPRHTPLAAAFGERVGSWFRALHEGGGVHFHLDRAPAEFRGPGRVREVVLRDGGRLACDLVVVGIGVRPATQYLEGSGLAVDGAVPVDARLTTRSPDVHAAGDIAVVPDPLTGRPRRVEHWVEAERQGRFAAHAMLDGAGSYGEIPFFWTRQFGRSVVHVGDSREWDLVIERGSVEDGEFAVGYCGDGRLEAVAAAGSRTLEAIAVGELMRAGREVTPDQFASAKLDPAALLLGREEVAAD